MSKNRTLLEEALVQTAGDWSDAAWIVNLAFRASGDAATAPAAALQVIIDGLSEGLLVAGDLDLDGFRPWPLSTTAAISRLQELWASLDGQPPEPDAIAWFDLTPVGEAAAARIRAREASGD